MRWHLALAALAMFSFSPSSAAAEEIVEDGALEPGRFWEDTLWGIPEKYYVKINVSTTSNVDVYVMNTTEYIKYLNGDMFKAEKQFLKVTDVKFTWKMEKTFYHIVIDNERNWVPLSANPTGVVVYHYSRSEPFQFLGPPPPPAGVDESCYFAAFLGAVVLVAVVMIIWRRKRKRVYVVEALEAPE